MKRTTTTSDSRSNLPILLHRISLNHSLNSMDSKNLAICWWPTLLPLHFSDMVMFEQMRPHLEESIQTMIDQYEFIFDDEEPRSLPC